MTDFSPRPLTGASEDPPEAVDRPTTERVYRTVRADQWPKRPTDAIMKKVFPTATALTRVRLPIQQKTSCWSSTGSIVGIIP